MTKPKTKGRPKPARARKRKAAAGPKRKLPPPPKGSVGAAVKELLKLRGMSPIELADKTGLTRQGIQYLLTTDRDSSFSTVRKIAKVLGVKVGTIADKMAPVKLTTAAAADKPAKAAAKPKPAKAAKAKPKRRARPKLVKLLKKVAATLTKKIKPSPAKPVPAASVNGSARPTKRKRPSPAGPATVSDPGGDGGGPGLPDRIPG